MGTCLARSFLAMYVAGASGGLSGGLLYRPYPFDLDRTRCGRGCRKRDTVPPLYLRSIERPIGLQQQAGKRVGAAFQRSDTEASCDSGGRCQMRHAVVQATPDALHRNRRLRQIRIGHHEHKFLATHSAEQIALA